MFEIVESSPAALAEAEKQGEVKSRTAYPFDKLGVGQSFTLPIADCNVKSLRTLVYRNSRKDDGKTFVMVVHDELNLVEVSRSA